ncbi:hypothetical protein [Bacillus cereus]|uniref:hypothetical protein n=1 Tax=Bacillus cereus TaxID=1396 RepID=UPI0024067037|nr:hypothetical protein [Bacillus cereus]MDF9638816.1 hypothetical protein [Bacillus cereus]
MNIIDNRKKVEEKLLTEGSVVVMGSGKQYLAIRDVKNRTFRLVKVEDMSTQFTFQEEDFNANYLKRNYNIKEIIPASEVQIVIGGIQ